MVSILRQLEDKPPELVMALLPSLVRTMLAALVELLAARCGAGVVKGSSPADATPGPLTR